MSRSSLLLPLTLVQLAACEQDYALTKESRRLTVTPDVADLGVLAVGDAAEGVISLAHTSGGDIEVVALDVLAIEGDAFTIDDGDLPVVAPDETATITILYAPDDDGYHRTRVTIHTDEERENEHTVELRGRAGVAVIEVVPGRIDFGPVDVGASAEQTVTLRNAGIVDWALDALDFSDAAFSSDEALPLAVGAGDNLDIVIRFTPTGDAAAVGEAVLSGSSADAPDVVLLGNACELGDPNLYDEDGDGWASCAADCDDGDATAHPGAEEACDGRDDDCDELIDEGTPCADDDGDGYTENEGDCSDADAAVSPGAEEVLDNGIDDDCDGVVDLGSDDPDGDGYSAAAGDCDDADATVFPGAAEAADGADEDCDGVIDEGTSAYDDDGDGWTEDAGDCDDSDADVSPSDAETGNGIDDDCDGDIDEGTSWADDDGDGWSERGGDCDDANPDINPGAYDAAGDGIDNDCDGVTR